MESILVGFTVCLTLAFLFSELFSRVRMPRVVGQIFAGIVLGIPLVKGQFSAGFPDFVNSLADIGVVFLMLLVGTELKAHELKRVSKRALYLAVLGYSIPLVMGFITMKMMGFETLTSVIIGICIAISAEAITIDILMEYNLLNTTLGITLMEAGMIDDLLGVLSLAMIIAVVQSGGIAALKTMPGEFMTFILIAYLIGFKILPKVAKIVWREKSEAAVFNLAVIFGLIVVLLSMSFGLSSVLGAFVAGLIMQLSIKNRLEEKEIVESLNIVTFGLVIPFFFISIGMNMDVMDVFNNLFFTIIITVLALGGKMIGTRAMGWISGIRNDAELTLIGWGMNPRGAVELIVASIARNNGLISEELFSAVAAMAIISALISPIMFRRALRRKEEFEKHAHHNHNHEHEHHKA